ncbi:MAG: hypothetical protein F4X05_12895 [Rhodothermaceae bacterium]|nr:hypothetical protein [Rhodothermaceae bacterium]MYD20529.1 hypothetical protein [Rhodothermaceae bacterium]MYJ55428.1 hypothetical protein [Rhodothermaceae bacterium]
MSVIVKRTVSVIEPRDNSRSGNGALRLRDFETVHSYVLLGEPGMGKSTEFNEEARRINADPTIPAPEFIRRKREYLPEWKKGPLFIDGLDEVRVGGGDPRDALNKIIEQLEALGKPPFRLSCRSFNWLEPGDRKRLAKLSDSEDIRVLQLNPLNYDDIRKIISEPNANAFIRQAREHSMEAFLSNPQLLDVLLKSVESGGWSESPTKIFENACRELIREKNNEHRDARSSEILPSPEAVLSAAGQLAAFMLIANKSGWSADLTQDSELLSLRDVKTQESSALLEAFNLGLFQGNRDCRIPIHRLMAEFLGARYLDQKIRSGLSLRRIFALLMGDDGVPFPDLRGLTAWLASLNSRARETLIHKDPVAIAFNGDASNFTRGERQELLKNLECAIDHTYTWPSAAALGALVGNQGESLVWELIGLPIRSESRQTLVYHLLRGVSQRYSGMSIGKNRVSEVQLDVGRKNLMNIVYDSSWQDDIRCQALRTLHQILVGKSDHENTFGQLLSDLVRDLLPDEKNNLRGAILDFLYPRELSPSEVWSYLVNRTVAYQHNIYLEFWDNLIGRSQDDQVRELLDSLCDHASEVIPKLENHRLSSIVPELLAKGIDLFGDELDISDLYRWFKLVEPDIQTSQLVSVNSSDELHNRNDEANTAIHDWLSEHETIQRALIECDLLTQESEISNDRTIGLKFVGTNTPTGFRSWCLSRAIELWETHSIAAKKLASWSVWAKEGWDDPLSDEKVERIVSDIPGLREWNHKRLSDKDRAEQKEAERSNKLAKVRATNLERRNKELEAIRQQKSELAKGNCSPALLHRLAKIYFDGLAKKGEDPKSHLESYLDGDVTLVQAALAGFRSVLGRDELPDLDHIAQLHENNKMSFFTLPFLAGMEEVSDGIIDSLSERGIKRALGFYLVMDQLMVPAIPRGENLGNLFTFYEKYHPPWYEKALKHYPEAVADSLVAIHNACVRAKLPPSKFLYEMVDNRAYFRVAQLAMKRMFSVFPTRCNERQLESLRVVLRSAIRTRGMSTEELRKLVLKRLNRKDMDIAQRAQWLCAGVHAARDSCLALLEEFLSTGQESRVHRVLSFLVPDGSKLILHNIGEWSSNEMSRLILALGKRVQRPDFQDDAHILSKVEINRNKFESLLTPWLQELIKRSDSDAMEALDSLATNPDLTVWKREIEQAQEERNRNRRAAKRPDLSLKQVQETLQGGPPASAADLAALTTDTLEELADRIRNGQTNDWRQYWYWDHKTKKPTHAKDENDCRDIFLSDLKAILRQHSIDAQPEGTYADENRADIRVSYKSNFSAPIEIKKNSHRKIWHGISEQLVPKYTRDPEADGYGIYLVFWFGTKHMKGGSPDEPQELKNLLERQLDPTLKNKIHIVVIDVSPSGRYA